MKQKILHLAAILAALLTLRPAWSRCAKIAEARTFLPKASVTKPTLRSPNATSSVNRGGASNGVAICGAADTPIAVCSDEAAAPTDLVRVRPFFRSNHPRRRFRRDRAGRVTARFRHT